MAVGVSVRWTVRHTVVSWTTRDCAMYTDRCSNVGLMTTRVNLELRRWYRIDVVLCEARELRGMFHPLAPLPHHT